jgi:hypothetical protein
MCRKEEGEAGSLEGREEEGSGATSSVGTTRARGGARVVVSRGGKGSTAGTREEEAQVQASVVQQEEGEEAREARAARAEKVAPSCT